MQNFRNLQVWSKAHALTLRVYQATRTFPREEVYGLTSQLRTSSASIASNIAEGCGRNGKSELRRFLEIAMGSASEVEYQLLLSRNLGYLTEELYSELDRLVREVKRMLAAFQVHLRNQKVMAVED